MLKSLKGAGPAAIVAVLLLLLAGSRQVPTVEADPSNLVVEATAAVGSTADLTFNVHDEGAGGTPGGGEVVLIATTSPSAGVGYFVDGLISNDDGDECDPPEGLGTKQLLWPGFSCLVDFDNNNTLEQVNGTAEWLCTGQGTVQFSLAQNGITLSGASFVTTCTAPVSAPVKLTLELTSEIEDVIKVCPSNVTIEARVLDVNDDPLPDGIVINFVARGGTLTTGFGVTINGFTETILQVPADAPVEVSILASATVAGVQLQELMEIDVACGRAFEASAVDFVISSPTVECGTSAFLGGRVVDSGGATVGDGTQVKLIATNGTLDPAETTTSGGMFTTTYKAPASAVIDTVTVAVKGFFASTKVTVTCKGVTPTPSPTPGPGGTATGATTAGGAAGAAGAGTGAAGAIQPPSTGGNGTIRPPSTGDAGLRTESGAPIGLAVIACLVAGVLAAATLRRAA
jgi:hypothetical protein